MTGRIEPVALADLRVDEELWGEGAEEIVLDWLRENYDPATMPRLDAATLVGREGVWLQGWLGEPSLLVTIFGEPYAIARLDQVRAGVAETEARESRLGLLDAKHREEGVE